jgi:3-methyladenine DNA glycosylase/8-oxoguanine DNA glycosylase
VRASIAVPDRFRLATVARSHGWYDLVPFAWDGTTLRTVARASGVVHDVAVTQTDGALTVTAKPGGAAARAELRAIVVAMLRLDEDLTGLYAMTDGDARLAYARAAGVGRLLRAPTAYEDVIKMLLTTNCSWSLTRVMVTRLVEELGEPAPSGARAFPTPAAMAKKNERFYRDVVRAGYRGPYLKTLATDIAEERIDLEELNDPDLPDDEVAQRLLALPGVGPYAAAHVMLTSLGRYSRLVLDSWTRPTYVKLAGARGALKDATIERRFKRYGEWAGLAFWLYLTRSWVEDGLPV